MGVVDAEAFDDGVDDRLEEHVGVLDVVGERGDLRGCLQPLGIVGQRLHRHLLLGDVVHHGEVTCGLAFLILEESNRHHCGEGVPILVAVADDAGMLPFLQHLPIERLYLLAELGFRVEDGKGLAEELFRAIAMHLGTGLVDEE